MILESDYEKLLVNIAYKLTAAKFWVILNILFTASVLLTEI